MNRIMTHTWFICSQLEGLILFLCIEKQKNKNIVYKYSKILKVNILSNNDQAYIKKTFWSDL